jgi:monooxygenase
MDKQGYRQVEPRAEEGELQPPLPLLSFTSGYVMRSLDQFPKQSAKSPWNLRQNYFADLLNLSFGSITDGTLVYSKGGEAKMASVPGASR